MNSSFIIKEYTDNYKEKVFSLRKAVYDETFDEDEWNWKFKSGKILIAVNDKDEVISLRPTIPIRLKFRDKTLKSGMNVDVMTHPDYRRMGLFSTLVNESFKMLKELGVHIVYTFPNNFSFPGYKKRIKWKYVDSLPLLVKVLKPRSFVKKYIKNPYVQKCLYPVADAFNHLIFVSKTKSENRNLLINQIYCFNENFDLLWQELSNQFEIAVIRDSKYLNWRYVQRPGYDYKIFSAVEDDVLKGYIVLREDTMFDLKLGLVVDILTFDDNTACSLLLHAYNLFKDNDMDIMGCLMLNTSMYFDVLKKAGFLKLPKKYSPKEFFFVVKADDDIIAPDVAYSSKNWFLTFGDIDIA
ncbi:GNAT family N-acetyltransferase [Methanobacterium sp.]|jgi:GNAT superfamily N-acetyltransferase|uniref:GNAT family N-acetyltransferase n=1 Tax=Methanobacterium sp. TaxID=2164 RepID=UPI00315828D5